MPRHTRSPAGEEAQLTDEALLYSRTHRALERIQCHLLRYGIVKSDAQKHTYWSLVYDTISTLSTEYQSSGDSDTKAELEQVLDFASGNASGEILAAWLRRRLKGHHRPASWAADPELLPKYRGITEAEVKKVGRSMRKRACELKGLSVWKVWDAVKDRKIVEIHKYDMYGLIDTLTPVRYFVEFKNGKFGKNGESIWIAVIMMLCSFICPEEVEAKLGCREDFDLGKIQKDAVEFLIKVKDLKWKGLEGEDKVEEVEDMLVEFYKEGGKFTHGLIYETDVETFERIRKEVLAEAAKEEEEEEKYQESTNTSDENSNSILAELAGKKATKKGKKETGKKRAPPKKDVLDYNSSSDEGDQPPNKVAKKGRGKRSNILAESSGNKSKQLTTKAITKTSSTKKTTKKSTSSKVHELDEMIVPVGKYAKPHIPANATCDTPLREPTFHDHTWLFSQYRSLYLPLRYAQDDIEDYYFGNLHKRDDEFIENIGNLMHYLNYLSCMVGSLSPGPLYGCATPPVIRDGAEFWVDASDEARTHAAEFLTMLNVRKLSVVTFKKIFEWMWAMGYNHDWVYHHPNGVMVPERPKTVGDLRALAKADLGRWAWVDEDRAEELLVKYMGPI